MVGRPTARNRSLKSKFCGGSMALSNFFASFINAINAVPMKTCFFQFPGDIHWLFATSYPFPGGWDRLSRIRDMQQNHACHDIFQPCQDTLTHWNRPSNSWAQCNRIKWSLLPTRRKKCGVALISCLDRIKKLGRKCIQIIS